MWRALLIMSASLALSASTTRANINFTNFGHAPEVWSGNGHYYQQWLGTWGPGDPQGDSFTFTALEAWVSGLKFNERTAHLATFTSQEEFNLAGTNYISSEKGYVGAAGNNTSTGYHWVFDGIQVNIFGRFEPDTRNVCPPYTRLYIVNAAWYGYSENIGCHLARMAGSATRNMIFTVEYEFLPLAVENSTWGRIKALYR